MKAKNLIGNYEYTEKKSKFIGYLYEIENEDDVKEILSNLKKEHPKARHMPHAYILKNTAKTIIYNDLDIKYGPILRINKSNTFISKWNEKLNILQLYAF